MAERRRQSPPLLPHERTIAILQKKWTPHIVQLLRDGPRRFTELYHEIPLVSHKVLTQQLRALERDRLIVRHVGVEGPRQVLYELSESGRSLLPILDALDQWGRQHFVMPDGMTSERRSAMAARRRSGETQARLLAGNEPPSAGLSGA
jgi:DNA-binding HxlR family transcriptional regulator